MDDVSSRRMMSHIERMLYHIERILFQINKCYCSNLPIIPILDFEKKFFILTFI